MSQDSVRVEQAALESEKEGNRALSLMRTSVGRNAGLVVALLLICVVGVITAGEQFASVDNGLTILRAASVIGVVSIGMTFVIIGGGIDLSVGAIAALASVRLAGRVAVRSASNSPTAAASAAAPSTLSVCSLTTTAPLASRASCRRANSAAPTQSIRGAPVATRR